MNINPTGDPWSFRNEKEATVVVATDAMKIKVEGKFRQRERKLFVLLIHSVWYELGKSNLHTVEIKKIKQIFSEITGVKNFTWLWEYLNNLAEVKISYSSERLRGLVRLLASVEIDEEREHVSFQIPDKLVEVLLAPKQWARIRTHFLLGLKGKYSVSLYQLLESKINLRILKKNNKIDLAGYDGYIDIPLDELKDWLCIGGEYKKWDHFNSRVLKPAVKEINENSFAATFQVATEVLREKKRKVFAIRFFLQKSPKRIQHEKSIQTSKEKQLEENLYKLVPQFEETWVIEITGKHCPGWDYRVIERQFREKVWKDGQTPKSPKAAFVGYCKAVGQNPVY